VKDRNEVVQPHGSAISGEKFEPKSMNVHYRFPAAVPV
jgi:hypothetical protein